MKDNKNQAAPKKEPVVTELVIKVNGIAVSRSVVKEDCRSRDFETYATGGATLVEIIKAQEEGAELNIQYTKKSETQKTIEITGVNKK